MSIHRPRPLVAIGVVLAASALLGLTPTLRRNDALASAIGDADVYAAGLAYAAEQLATGRVDTVCVGLDFGSGPQDPSPSFLDRFEPPLTVGSKAPPRRSYRVRPASQCRVSKDGATLLDGRTPAVALTGLRLHRVSDEQQLVDVLYVFTWRQRGIRTYEVTRIDTPRGPIWRAAGEVIKQAPF